MTNPIDDCAVAVGTLLALFPTQFLLACVFGIGRGLIIPPISPRSHFQPSTGHGKLEKLQLVHAFTGLTFESLESYYYYLVKNYLLTL